MHYDLGFFDKSAVPSLNYAVANIKNGKQEAAIFQLEAAGSIVGLTSIAFLTGALPSPRSNFVGLEIQ